MNLRSQFSVDCFRKRLRHLLISGGFMRVGSRVSSGPPLGDGLTPSLMVLLINGTVLWRQHRHVSSFWIFIVLLWNMVLRIFKTIATSGVLTALECTKFVFGSVPGPTGGAYSAPPAGLRGPTSKGKEREVERTGGTGLLYANSWIRPLSMLGFV